MNVSAMLTRLRPLAMTESSSLHSSGMRDMVSCAFRWARALQSSGCPVFAVILSLSQFRVGACPGWKNASSTGLSILRPDEEGGLSYPGKVSGGPGSALSLE